MDNTKNVPGCCGGISTGEKEQIRTTETDVSEKKASCCCGDIGSSLSSQGCCSSAGENSGCIFDKINTVIFSGAILVAAGIAIYTVFIK